MLVFNKKLTPSQKKAEVFEKIKDQKYYVVPIKPGLALSFFKVLLKDELPLPEPVFVDYALFKYKILLTRPTLDLLLQTYTNTYFSQDIKKYLYINGKDSLKDLCKEISLIDYFEYETKKQHREFKINDVVILTLDNRYYVIESLNLKKNEAIINSKIAKNSSSEDGNTIIKVKLDHLRHVD